jgi:hypothetical protein
MSSEIKPLPVAFVSKTNASLRIEQFQNGKHGLLSNALGRADTKAVWYAINHLKQLLEELEYQQASGMRAYFATYPDTHPDYPGQLCLIMVPTKANANMEHEDIILDDQPGFGDRLAGFDPNDIEEMYLNFNFGSPCPPACGKHRMRYPLVNSN